MTAPVDYGALFEPVALGRLTMKNRLAMSAHNGALPPDRYLGYLAARAAGGVGLIVAGGANGGVAEYGPLRGFWAPGGSSGFDFVGPNPATAAGIAYYDDLLIPLLRERAEVVHDGGALCVGQVFHLGAYREVDNLQAGVGPSAGLDAEGFGCTHELEPAEIEELIAAYAAAVRRTQRAGLDGAELHAAHGFLVNAFLSPASNRRTDEWGGDLDGRARFLSRIIAASRELVGPDYPLGLRIGAEAFAGGLSGPEVVAICRRFEAELAYVSISGGSVSGASGGPAYAASRFDDAEPNLAVAAAVRAAVSVPVMAAGRILTPARVAAAVRDGACDVVAMARPFIADPDWVAKLQAGVPEQIRPCIRANECHQYHGARAHLSCAVNPRAGREIERRAEPARPVSVLVVGAGPAGLQAAIGAAERGHQVTLADARERPGGELATLIRAPFQTALADYLTYQLDSLDRLGVQLRMSWTVTADDVLDRAPDVVLVAVGADCAAGSSQTVTVLTDRDVLAGAPVVGPVLVDGGLEDHLDAMTVAHLLAAQGHRVRLISERDRLGTHADPMTRLALLRLLATAGVETAPFTAYAGSATDSVLTVDRLTGQTAADPAIRTVVRCGRRVARTALARALRPVHKRVYAIGDCVAPRRIVHAVLDADRVTSTI